MNATTPISADFRRKIQIILAEKHAVGVGVIDEFELEMLVVGEVQSMLVEGMWVWLQWTRICGWTPGRC